MFVLGEERDYIVHDEHNIKGFFGDYRFLSNFHKCDIYYKGMKFSSTEAAYQASKLSDKNKRFQYTFMDPALSKKESKKIKEPEGWYDRKYNVMSLILFEKFCEHKNLRDLLLSTGNKYLEETNHWGDIYWGVCDGNGQNNLGKILMKIRKYWQDEKIL